MDVIPFNEESIYHVARRIGDREARDAYLRQVCGDDTALRDRLDALLRVCEQEASFLESPAVSPPATMTVAGVIHPPAGHGAVIGPYKLLEQIGEGGMGTVFMAEQTHPVRRKVALKLIKPGMDTKQVVARFEAERQALALMDHANIARVIDAGATESGRPYFVMELVRGVPITDYCDRANLPIPERLGLFVQVCQAVQHAHLKGIIHRDLKPSNILVTLHDGVPVPKVIDFGVAKATGQQLTDKTLYTGFLQLVGTPLYMSPEQAEMSGLDVDTRSDVYSLGVLLYELLTGTTPFDQETLRQAAFDEVRRIIREEEPPKPSTRLNTLGDELTDVSSHRGSDPRRLGKVIRGELDWIVMKALEKNRERRYETANGLAADVRHYLADEPVQACPPSAWYQLRRFSRCNRVALATSAIVILALVLGTAVSTWQAVRALKAERAALQGEATIRRERDRALKAERQATALATQAKTEASISKAVNDFLLNDLLAEASPEKNARAGQVTVEAVLKKAATRIPGKFDGLPEVEAAIRATIGNTFKALGLYKEAQPHLERALELRRRGLGKEHADTLRSMNDLASLYARQREYAKAEVLLINSLDLCRRVLGEEHPQTLESMSGLGTLYYQQRKDAKAEPLLIKSLELCRRVLGEEHPQTLATMNNLGNLLTQQGQDTKAEPLHVKTLELNRRVLGEEHPQTLGTMNNLGLLLKSQGQDAKAEPLFVKTLELDRRVLGPEHPQTLITMNNLMSLYRQQGQDAKAEALLVKSLELCRRVLGEEHPDTLTRMQKLADFYKRQGQHAKAEALFAEALEIQRRVFGPEHQNTLIYSNIMANIYQYSGQYAKAELLFTEALEVQRRVLGPEHPDTLTTMQNLAVHCRIQGQYAKGELLFTPLLEIRRRVLGPVHDGTFATMGELAKLYRYWGRYEKAKSLESLKLEVARRNPGNDRLTCGTLLNLGMVLLKEQKYAEAEPLLRESLALREKLAPDGWVRFETASMLGASLLGQKKYAKAEPLLIAGCEGMKAREVQVGPWEKGCMTEAAEWIVQLYEAWGKPEKAEEWKTKLGLADLPADVFVRPALSDPPLGRVPKTRPIDR